MKKHLFLLSVTSLFILLMIRGNANGQQLNKSLNTYINDLEKTTVEISKERKEVLNNISETIISKLDQTSSSSLLFVCTQNSRRSQLAQIWLQTAFYYYGIKNVKTFSGGIDPTKFHDNALAALERAGFSISKDNKSTNPIYSISNGIETFVCFSKKYSDNQNPHSDFIAVMVCSDADKSCPIIEKSSERYSLPYDDPRYYDNTPSAMVKYDITARTIALEMFYLASITKEKIIHKIEISKR
ncbi:protein-tyrosine-phosphatase [Flammeovirgaceae bacterium SG7u.111]|nr:protein-tyrosine-phosphatase [Flammeovirgaceae bacterium SG7u.132]WPO35703.1 protein-tyrosine-phosphatase [Flammeovirgaceae bacterium SG7u.111]